MYLLVIFLISFLSHLRFLNKKCLFFFLLYPFVLSFIFLSLSNELSLVIVHLIFLFFFLFFFLSAIAFYRCFLFLSFLLSFLFIRFLVFFFFLHEYLNLCLFLSFRIYCCGYRRLWWAVIISRCIWPANNFDGLV